MVLFWGWTKSLLGFEAARRACGGRVWLPHWRVVFGVHHLKLSNWDTRGVEAVVWPMDDQLCFSPQVFAWQLQRSWEGTLAASVGFKSNAVWMFNCIWQFLELSETNSNWPDIQKWESMQGLNFSIKLFFSFSTFHTSTVFLSLYMPNKYNTMRDCPKECTPYPDLNDYHFLAPMTASFFALPLSVAIQIR